MLFVIGSQETFTIAKLSQLTISQKKPLVFLRSLATHLSREDLERFPSSLTQEIHTLLYRKVAPSGILHPSHTLRYPKTNSPLRGWSCLSPFLRQDVPSIAVISNYESRPATISALQYPKLTRRTTKPLPWPLQTGS